VRIVLILLVVFLVVLCGAGPTARAEPPRAVLLLVAQSEGGTVATFGRDGIDAGPLARSIQDPFEKSGIHFVPATAAAPVMGAAPGGLPLGDAAARTMAEGAGAGIAVVVGLVAASQGSIRATSLVGQVATIRLRVIDVLSGKVVFDRKATAAAYGPEDTQARASASRRVILQGSRGLLATVLREWPDQFHSKGELTVIVTGAEGWRPITTVIRSLVATRGVSDLHALQISPERVFFTLQSQQGEAQVVNSLRRARIADGKLSVQISGDAILVRIIQEAASILPPVQND